MSEIKLAAFVAMSENRVIGRDNDLPWHIPEDLKRFKTMTMGKPVVMGRKTFESIVKRLGKPLPGRKNIVISRHAQEIEGADLYDNLDDAFVAAKKEAREQGIEEVIVGGGAQIYEASLPYLDRIYLTIVEMKIDGDAYFPELDQTQWTVSEDQRHIGNPSYRFQTLDKKP